VTGDINGIEDLAWNWSPVADKNFMFVGDTWTAQFEIEVVGPPKGTLVPVDACDLPECAAAGSSAVQGFLTEASYLPAGETQLTRLSFPLAQIFVGGDSSVPTSTTPPPPPPAGGPPPSPTAAPVFVPSPVLLPVILASPAAGISTPAAAVGLLAAGFARIAIRSRPVAVPVATTAGPMAMGRIPRSKFDEGAQSENDRLSRHG
jgi:hypothetical protein